MKKMRAPNSLFLIATIFLSSEACKPKGPPPVEPGDQVRYEMPSHRCAGKDRTCACRVPTDPSDAPEKISIPDGYRRFEVKLASINPAIVMNFSGQPYELRTNGESPRPFCWYFDLPIGKTEVSLRSREFKENPVQPTVFISEYRPEDQRWVSLIQLRCGSTQDPCSPDIMTAQKQEAFASYDRCAHSDIKELHWGGSLIDEHYESLNVNFSLLVNKPQEQNPAWKCLQKKDVPAVLDPEKEK
jgi:hypothetical protein